MDRRYGGEERAVRVDEPPEVEPKPAVKSQGREPEIDSPAPLAASVGFIIRFRARFVADGEDLLVGRSAILLDDGGDSCPDALRAWTTR